MTALKFFVFTISSLAAYCQSESKENIVLRILNQAVEARKLPLELINMKDSINYLYNAVVVQNTKENGLKVGVHLQRDDVDYGIWSAEELFTRDPYWITPSSIKINGKRMSFNFTTTYLNMRNRKCYKGEVKAKWKKGAWILTGCSSEEMECKFDLKKLSEESKLPQSD
jgi:hypothetical protein